MASNKKAVKELLGDEKIKEIKVVIVGNTGEPCCSC